MYWTSIVQVSGSDFTTADVGAAPLDITGLTYAASANTKYEFEVILVGQSSTSAGVRFAMAFSAAGATGTWVAMGATTTSGANSLGQTFGVAASGFWLSAATDESFFMRGIISIGANAGNITAQLNKVTSGTATVYIGSEMKIKAL